MVYYLYMISNKMNSFTVSKELIDKAVDIIF